MEISYITQIQQLDNRAFIILKIINWLNCLVYNAELFGKWKLVTVIMLKY